MATLSAGTYTIEATTFAAGATGDFTLPVKGLRDSGTTPGLGSRDSDREVLIALFHATDGPNWTNSDNWLTDEPLGERRGVITDVHGRVISLEVFRSSLDDPIPAILGNLDRLERLSLSGNELSGTIPGDLGTLSELKELDLRDNHLRGEIPAELNHSPSPRGPEPGTERSYRCCPHRIREPGRVESPGPGGKPFNWGIAFGTGQHWESV